MGDKWTRNVGVSLLSTVPDSYQAINKQLKD